MSINKVEEMVESYLNGNISDFKRWLKKTNKQNAVLALQILGDYYYVQESQRNGYEKAVRIIYQYLVA